MSFYIKAVIFLTAFLPVAVWVNSLIDILFALFIAPLFCLKCNHISLFGLTFQKDGGKWHCSFKKLSTICQHNIVADLSKAESLNVTDDLDRKDGIYSTVRVCTLLLISFAVLLLNIDAVEGLVKFKSLSPLELFWASLAIGMVFHAIISFGIYIYTYKVVMKRLGGYNQSLINRIRRGETFETFDLKPLSQLPYKNPSNTEKMIYYNIYLTYLLAVGRYDAMREPICEMTEHFRNREYILQYTGSYYLLVFYYSKIELNAALTNLFLEKVSSAISSDPDSNAKRVLAYYHYYVMNDAELAKKYIDDGFAVLDKFSVEGGERELERRLLSELDDVIKHSAAY